MVRAPYVTSARVLPTHLPAPPVFRPIWVNREQVKWVGTLPIAVGGGSSGGQMLLLGAG